MSEVIGFFGGAFSPLHAGHIRMVFEVLEKRYVSKVVMVPASDAYQKPNLLPASERLSNLSSIFKWMSSVEVSTLDTSKSHFPHPLATAQELVDKFSCLHEELIWIMGGDRLDWIANNDDLKKMTLRYKFIIFERLSFSESHLRGYSKVKEVEDRLIFLPAIPFQDTKN